MDEVDRRLVNLVQAQFPLEEMPYAGLGGMLGIDGAEVIGRIEGLKDQGIVRVISPVFNAGTLGYKTTLVAAEVPGGELEKAAQQLIEHPGVGHCYEREHRLNLWSTLSLPGDADAEKELARLRGLIGGGVLFDLPTVRVFKIGAFFDVDGQGCPVYDGVGGRTRAHGGPVGLSATDRAVINAVQQDLALIDRPFDELAAHAGLGVQEFLAVCRSLVERGVIRRYGASINHRSVGYTANAMACWVVPPDMIEKVGRMLTALPTVSHCYERRTNRLWPYNLFGVVHSNARDECEAVADRISQETGLRDYVLLFSTKEYKKMRVTYRV